MKNTMYERAIEILEKVAYFKDLRTDNKEIIKSLLISLDVKDPYTLDHSIRVGKYAYGIASKLELPFNICEEIQIAGILHDIGKIGVTTEILIKPYSLTIKEFDEIKEHPTLGYKILNNLDFSDVILNAVRFHHKRYDLRGYPTEIELVEKPIEADIISIADAFDAMISNRVYRGALTLCDAIAEMEKNKGSQFHPEVTEVFIKELYNSFHNNFNKLEHDTSEYSKRLVKILT